MVYVRIELWPGGDRKRCVLLHEGTVTNDGTGTESQGNYVAQFSKRGGFKHPDGKSGAFRDAGQHELVRIVQPDARSIWRRAHLSGFRRKAFGAWRLLLWSLAVAHKEDYEKGLT